MDSISKITKIWPLLHFHCLVGLCTFTFVSPPIHSVNTGLNLKKIKISENFQIYIEFNEPPCTHHSVSTCLLTFVTLVASLFPPPPFFGLSLLPKTYSFHITCLHTYKAEKVRTSLSDIYIMWKNIDNRLKTINPFPNPDRKCSY